MRKMLYIIGSGFLLRPGSRSTGFICWPQKLDPAVHKLRLDARCSRYQVSVPGPW